jgi:hypothetical protein
MKKTILTKNYSLLVLVILILYLTYINLPKTFNIMSGGAVFDPNNPYLGMDDDTLSTKLASISGIYSFLKNYLWVYIIIIVLLASVTAYYASTQYEVQGIPLAGVNPGVSWEGEGPQFINFFYLMAKSKYGLFAPGTHGAPDNETPAMKTFEEDFDKFLLYPNALGAIDLYCNIVKPCSTCHCSGPDTNYAGPSASTPMVPYVGIDSGTKQSCQPDNSDGGKAGQAIKDYHSKRGVEDKMFGRIPNCCCHLWQTATGGNVTPETVTNVINTLQIPNAPSGSVGIDDSTGCEPVSAPSVSGVVNGAPSTIKPHTSPSGTNMYVYNMVKACLGKDAPASLEGYKMPTAANPGTFSTTTLWPSVDKCKDYDTSLDHGISYIYALKHKKNYITPSIGDIPKAEHAGDVKPNWTDGVWTQTSGSAPNIKPVKPVDWPSTFSDMGKNMVNNNFYTSSTGVKYQLKIDNYLFEIYAYPVKAVDSKIYTKEITTTNNPTGFAYLEKYLSTSGMATTTASGDLSMYQGSYVFPLLID